MKFVSEVTLCESLGKLGNKKVYSY